jgi:hypothetical protein
VEAPSWGMCPKPDSMVKLRLSQHCPNIWESQKKIHGFRYFRFIPLDFCIISPVKVALESRPSPKLLVILSHSVLGSGSPAWARAWDKSWSAWERCGVQNWSCGVKFHEMSSKLNGQLDSASAFRLPVWEQLWSMWCAGSLGSRHHLNRKRVHFCSEVRWGESLFRKPDRHTSLLALEP